MRLHGFKASVVQGAHANGPDKKQIRSPTRSTKVGNIRALEII